LYRTSKQSRIIYIQTCAAVRTCARGLSGWMCVSHIKYNIYYMFIVCVGVIWYSQVYPIPIYIYILYHGNGIRVNGNACENTRDRRRRHYILALPAIVACRHCDRSGYTHRHTHTMTTCRRIIVHARSCVPKRTERTDGTPHTMLKTMIDDAQPESSNDKWPW